MNAEREILRRLRESKAVRKISEARNGSYEYLFRIPWREYIDYEQDSEYHYKTSQMEYAGDIMESAMEDWNGEDWSKYTKSDIRTKNAGILKMTMDFNSKSECIITVTTEKMLLDDQINEIISYLEGQMSDGWGEGFEQREVAKFNHEYEEELEDEDGEYYTETYPVKAYVYGQFWWNSRGYHDHEWEIEFLEGPVLESESETLEEDESEEEKKHSYVGKKVRCNKSGRTYRVTRAYDTRDGVAVRVDIDGGHQTLTFKPDEYKVISETIKEASQGALEISDSIFDMKRGSDDSWDFYEQIRNVVLSAIEDIDDIDLDDDGVDSRGPADNKTIEYRAQLYTATVKGGDIIKKDVSPSAKRVILKSIESNIILPKSNDDVDYDIEVRINRQELSITLNRMR